MQLTMTVNDCHKVDNGTTRRITIKVKFQVRFFLFPPPTRSLLESILVLLLPIQNHYYYIRFVQYIQEVLKIILHDQKKDHLYVTYEQQYASC